MTQRLYVVARNYQEFRFWCWEHDLNPHWPLFRYVAEPHHLMGTRGATVLLIPGWVDRPDWRQIDDMLLIREARVIWP